MNGRKKRTTTTTMPRQPTSLRRMLMLVYGGQQVVASGDSFIFSCQSCPRFCSTVLFRQRQGGPSPRPAALNRNVDSAQSGKNSTWLTFESVNVPKPNVRTTRCSSEFRPIIIIIIIIMAATIIEGTLLAALPPSLSPSATRRPHPRLISASKTIRRYFG